MSCSGVVGATSGRFYITDPPWGVDPLPCDAWQIPGRPAVVTALQSAGARGGRELLLFAICLGLFNPTNSAEALLELVDPPFGVNELLLTGKERVRVGGDPDGDDKMIHSVDLLNSIGLCGRARNKLLTGAHVLEDDRIIFWVEIRFHEMAP